MIAQIVSDEPEEKLQKLGFFACFDAYHWCLIKQSNE